MADAAAEKQPDLAVVAALAPNAVLCLISALSYHGIKLSIPVTMFSC
jgi:hypothetical protein